MLDQRRRIEFASPHTVVYRLGDDAQGPRLHEIVVPPSTNPVVNVRVHPRINLPAQLNGSYYSGPVADKEPSPKRY